MRNRIFYATVAGLAFAALGTVSQKAVAEDNCYFQLTSPLTAIPESTRLMDTTVETTLSFPVVMERTGSTTAVVVGTTLKPVLIERTTVVKPPRFLSFGVWP